VGLVLSLRRVRPKLLMCFDKVYMDKIQLMQNG
jgi:hypothetical protein